MDNHSSNNGCRPDKARSLLHKSNPEYTPKYKKDSLSNESAWGYHLTLDLRGCPKEKIAEADNISRWTDALVQAIDMKAYGPPQIEHFATHSHDACGYTLTQLIETSNISAHFAENRGEAYIDIFSCKEFSADIAERVCRDYFAPTSLSSHFFYRGGATHSNSATFTETLYGKAAFQGFQIEEILYDSQSKYQSIQVFETKLFGRTLVLDGVIQTTEKDEAAYHEMLTHVPLCSHQSPQRVLIVGGGDGGILREVLKHAINSVDLVELDNQVVEISAKLLPTLNNNGTVFEDPRCTLHIQDAYHFLTKCHPHTYDVIIVDSPDPIGEAEKLFSLDFYKLVTKALTPNGIIVNQSGIAFFQSSEIKNTLKCFHECGLTASPYTTVVPSYYGGYMMLGFGAKEPSFSLPLSEDIERRFQKVQGVTRHYTPKLHLSSFLLPQWIQDEIQLPSQEAYRSVA